MKKYPLPHDFRTCLPYLILAVFLSALMPRTAKFEYGGYRLGDTWNNETLVAQFDFSVYKTPEQLRVERSREASAAVPYFRYSEESTTSCLKKAESVARDLGDSQKSVFISSVRSIFSSGIISDDAKTSGDIIYIHKDKRASRYPLSSVYTVSSAKEKLEADMVARCPEENVSRAVSLSRDVFEPNLLYDERTTKAIAESSRTAVSEVSDFKPKGTTIVSKGELITDEVYQQLQSYEQDYRHKVEGGVPAAMRSAGNILSAAILVVILLLSIFFANPKIFDRKGEHLYLLVVFALASLVPLVICRTGRPDIIYFVPVTVFALYLQAFFRNRMIISVYIVSLLPMLILMPQGGPLFVMYLLAGLVGIAMFQTFNKGWMQFFTALSVFAALVVSYLSFRATGLLAGVAGPDILKLLTGSLLTVAAYPLIYLFERVFGLLSISRLDELADTSNDLLRELEVKAPGTFQHSLQVMSMADSCARAIGANAHLVRVGALYHDIGKMADPQCFIENESMVSKEEGAKYHTSLSPKDSAARIIRHVSEGIAIAQKYHLPEQVQDFIITHHGTSRMKFFYNKYVSQGGSPEDLACFSYPGRKPTSKEQVILMLCDTVEAASRTLKDYSKESFSQFVDSMIGSKIEEQQLTESEMPLKDLYTVKETLKSYLAQMYHARVEYPEAQKNSEDGK